MVFGWVILAESDDVRARGSEHVLDVGFGQALVAAVAQAVGVDGFRGGGLASGPDRVVPLPVGGLLLSAGACLDLLQRLGHQEQVPALAVEVAGACLAICAFTAGFAGKQD